MNYRATRSAYLNCEKRIFDGVGPLDIPPIKPIDIDLTGAKAIGFNRAKTCKHPEDYILHFFIDDYQFERVWNHPDVYIPLLSKFKAVVAPDFSPYTDFPKVVQMFNHYRKHWCAAYWQECGIPVIPDIQWGLDDLSSFDFCLDGEPRNSLICISTKGGFKNKVTKKQFLTAWDIILKRLKPKEILLFGKHFPEITADVTINEVKDDNITNKVEKSKVTNRGNYKFFENKDYIKELEDGKR